MHIKNIIYTALDVFISGLALRCSISIYPCRETNELITVYCLITLTHSGIEIFQQWSNVTQNDCLIQNNKKNPNLDLLNSVFVSD